MPVPARIAAIHTDQLAAWAKAGGKRYSDQELIDQLTSCSQRLGCSPTMREFEADPETIAHPQTIIERFGSWNEAKRKAGLRARRFATDTDLIDALKDLAAEIGRTPNAADIKAGGRRMPALTTFIHHFKSLPLALQAAGFDVPANADERLDRAIRAGVRLTQRLGKVPSMTAWKQLRASGEDLPSEWAIYRLCTSEHGRPWAIFTQLVNIAIDEQEREQAA